MDEDEIVCLEAEVQMWRAKYFLSLATEENSEDEILRWKAFRLTTSHAMIDYGPEKIYNNIIDYAKRAKEN